MKALPYFASLLLGFSVYAQETSLPVRQQIVNQVGKDGYMGVVQTYDSRYQGVQGTPYFQNTWFTGDMEYANGMMYENIPMKYDMFNDELWVKNQIQQEVIIFHHTLRRFLLKVPDAEEPLVFEKARYIEGLTTLVEPEQMVQIIHDDGFKVVAVRQKVLQRADYKGGYSMERYHDEFREVDPRYYYIGKDQVTKKFKPKERSVLKVFPAHTDELKEFMSGNKLDLADPADMAQLLGHVDQTDSSEH